MEIIKDNTKHVTHSFDRKFMTRKEAAEYINISLDKFDEFDIPYISLGKRFFRYDIDDLNSFMFSRRVSNSFINE